MKEHIKNLFLIGDIEDSLTKHVLTSLWDDPSINKITQLNIQIQTIGGDLHCCFALLDSIEYLKEQMGFEINTFGLGKVASAGFFLFLLGDNRTLFPSTRVFVHEHLVLNDEDSPYSLKLKEFKEDKAIYDIYCQYTMRRLNLTSRRAKALLKKNKWLTNPEIQKYNIITKD